VSVHGLARTALILLPLTTCAARLHAHALTPGIIQQEMIRCLRVVSLAARRPGDTATPVQPVEASRSRDL
jgi:hypothetical protein